METLDFVIFGAIAVLFGGGALVGLLVKRMAPGRSYVTVGVAAVGRDALVLVQRDGADSGGRVARIKVSRSDGRLGARRGLDGPVTLLGVDGSKLWVREPSGPRTYALPTLSPGPVLGPFLQNHPILGRGWSALGVVRGRGALLRGRDQKEYVIDAQGIVTELAPGTPGRELASEGTVGTSLPAGRVPPAALRDLQRPMAVRDPASGGPLELGADLLVVGGDIVGPGARESLRRVRPDGSVVWELDVTATVNAPVPARLLWVRASGGQIDLAVEVAVRVDRKTMGYGAEADVSWVRVDARDGLVASAVRLE